MILDLVRPLGEEEMTLLTLLKKRNKHRRMGKRGMFNHSPFSRREESPYLIDKILFAILHCKYR
jgi:hypothetical protein